ncbi:MAG: segregation/condensation protein A [Tissierellia bacterium]|nr:segregation/condensation protein A [Tissierellia bacterium]
MEYKIVLESFEGPLDLLLHLIDKAQIDIYDIPINEITGQYIEYITKMEELDLEVTSEFLVMAATLLEIKSKMLLPQLERERDSEQLEMEEVDPRLELVRRLVEYKKYKYASKELQDFEKVQRKIYYKPKEDLSYFVEDDKELEEVDLRKLVEVLNELLHKNKEAKTSINISEVQKEEYTLDECVKKIKEKLKEEKTINFSDLFDKKSNRKEIIVTFLSILELIRVKHITIYQEDNFSDILIRKKGKEGA